MPKKQLAIRILTGTWFLMALVLLYSFTGNLTSYLATPKLESIPNSFEELAARTDYKISVIANSVLSQTIKVTIVFGYLMKGADYRLHKITD